MIFELEKALSLMVYLSALMVAVAATVLSLRLISHFKGSVLEAVWKILILVPIIMHGIIICELLNITVPRIRVLFALAASMVFLFCVYRFYKLWPEYEKEIKKRSVI